MEIEVLKQKQLSRLCKVIVNKKEFRTPVFFPSISSTQDKYDSCYKIIMKKNPDYFISSAYDLKLDLKKQKQISKLKSVLYLDSGGYELKVSHNPKRWTIDDLINIIQNTHFDLIATLDNLDGYDVANKYTLVKNEILINNYIAIEEETNYNNLVVFSLTEREPNRIISQIRSVLQKIAPNAFSIPEDYLGDDFEKRVKNLEMISRTLHELQKKPILIHIRGCSDPDLIIQYTNVGADLFDGLGWSSKVIKWNKTKPLDRKWFSEYDTGKLIDCDCLVCVKNKRKDYFTKLYLHNLYAFTKLIEDIHSTFV